MVQSKNLLIIFGLILIILYIVFPNFTTSLFLIGYVLAVFVFRTGIADKFLKKKK